MHCVKSDPIRSAFSPIQTEYGEILSLRIQSECGKMRTGITLNTDTFYEMMLTRHYFHTKYKYNQIIISNTVIRKYPMLTSFIDLPSF